MPTRAKISIIGLYNYDESVFEKMILPDGIEKDVAIMRILFDNANFELMLPQLELVKEMIGVWSKSHFYKWKTLFETTQLDYNPIWNVDANESETTQRTLERNKSGEYEESATNSGNRTQETNLNENGENLRTLDTEKDLTNRKTISNEKDITNTKTFDTEKDLTNRKTISNEKDVTNTKTFNNESNESMHETKNTQIDENGGNTRTLNTATSKDNYGKLAGFNSNNYNNVTNNSGSGTETGTITDASNKSSEEDTVSDVTNAKTENGTNAETAKETESGDIYDAGNEKETGTNTEIGKEVESGNISDVGNEKETGTIKDEYNKNGNEAVTESNSGNTFASGNNTDIEDVNETVTLTKRRTGNIGVTMTQQLIEAERNVAKFSIYEVISNDFKHEFCIMVY